MAMGKSINLRDTLQEDGGLGRGELLKILGGELGRVSLMARVIPLLGEARASSGKSVVELVVHRGLMFVGMRVRVASFHTIVVRYPPTQSKVKSRPEPTMPVPASQASQSTLFKRSTFSCP